MPSRVPLYGLEESTQTISRQAAKLLVKQRRAQWIDPNTREHGIIIFPKELSTRMTTDGHVVLGNNDPNDSIGDAADPRRYRQRVIQPTDELLWALRLPLDYPRRAVILKKARQAFDVFLDSINETC